ncbi:hypothetical protein Tco_0009758 [Tanacetum coccineum]
MISQTVFMAAVRLRKHAPIMVCPKLPSQTFEEPTLEEDILSFIRNLGHTGEIKFYLMSTSITGINHGDHLMP